MNCIICQEDDGEVILIHGRPVHQECYEERGGEVDDKSDPGIPKWPD